MVDKPTDIKSPKNKLPTRVKQSFISLKWKVVIILSLVLIIINSGTSYITYWNLERQFANKQQQQFKHQQHEFNGLMEQSYSRLLQLIDMLNLLTKNNNVSFDNILESHWELLQLDWGLESTDLYDRNGNHLKHWGNSHNGAIINWVNTVRQTLTPLSALQCNKDCYLYVIAPIISAQPDTQILVVSSSIADLLLTMKQVSHADMGILSRSLPDKPDNKNMRFLPNWQLTAVALTDAKHRYPLLRKLSDKTSLASVLNNGSKQLLNHEEYSIRLLPLESSLTQAISYLVLINSISKERRQIRQGLQQAILVSVIGFFISESLILLMLWVPMVRLRRLADALPLLAKSAFESVRQRLQKNPSLHWFQDELDTLDNTAIVLSSQLERLENEVELRTRELEYHALYDTLTHLPNRRLFQDRIAHGLKSLERSKDKIAILFLDLDNFKRINDSLGHHTGDELLVKVAEILKACIRRSDTVARIGGDEFSILLYGIQDNYSACSVATEILKKLRNPIMLFSSEVIVTTSIGISIAPDNGTSPEALMRNADLAMYRAKGKGKDKYHYYTAEMNKEVQDQLTLENDLRRAIEQNELELFYQPQIHLTDYRIIGAEALLRWRHPHRGLVSPLEFIPVLEDTGLITPVGENILNSACKQAQDWHEQGQTAFKISINLSARQFLDPRLVDSVKNALSISKLPARDLELELTESMLMDNINDAIQTLQELKQLGISLAIDDFGTGYSSLSYLKQFPVDILKVDRQFVRDIPGDNNDMAITAAVIAMAHKLNLRVIAEGVETEEQLHFLQENHCEIAQGYLFGKPMTAEDLSRFFLQYPNRHIA